MNAAKLECMSAASVANPLQLSAVPGEQEAPITNASHVATYVPGSRLHHLKAIVLECDTNILRCNAAVVQYDAIFVQ